MKRLLCFALLFLLANANPSFSSSAEETIAFWLKKVGSGLRDLQQPFFPSPEVSPAYVYSFPEMRLSEKENFAAFLSATDNTMRFWFVASGDSTPVNCPLPFDSRGLNRDVIAAVLNRRTPLINSFDFDKTKYNGDNPRYICRSTLGSSYDYLGYIQIRLIIILFVSNDFRFKNEAEGLLSYIRKPPKSENWLEHMEDFAFLCYTSDSRTDLPLFLKTYIKACSKSQTRE